jgi:hypothetical protein
MSRPDTQRGQTEMRAAIYISIIYYITYYGIIVTPALAETLTCSTWQGITTCSSPDGYVNHETQWQGFTIGEDNHGGRQRLSPGDWPKGMP